MVALLSGFVSTLSLGCMKDQKLLNCELESSCVLQQLSFNVFSFDHLFLPTWHHKQNDFTTFAIEKNWHSCLFKSVRTVCVVFVALSKLKHSPFVLCVCCHFHSMCHHFRTFFSVHIMTLASVLDIVLSPFKGCVDFHMFCNALNVASQFF